MEEQTFEKDLGKVVGTDGITPHIGENGNWFFGEKDSGVPATGPQGEKGEPGTAPPLYRHRVRASGAVTSGSITHYAAAYIDVYTRSDTAILSARNLAEALSISYGGTKNVPASGYRENGATHTVLCTEATVTADTSSDVSDASVTLHGMYFGCDNYNDGYIERVTVAATEFSDEVTAV